MPIDYKSMSNYYLNGNLLVPVIGGEVLKIRKGSNDRNEDRLLTFDQYLIEEITGLFYEDQGCPKTISELVMRKPKLSRFDIISTYRKIPNEAFVTSGLEKLVRLSKLNLFITTSYDRKVEDLMQAEHSVKPEAIFWNHEKRDPLLLNLKDEKRRIVYLFGAVSEGPLTQPMAINDEDKLESLFSLSLANSRNPSTIMDSFSFLEYLRGKILLFIGNNFQDWFMKFLVRTLYNSPYKKEINEIYIVNDKNSQLGFEKYFFEKYGIQLIHDSPIEDVIDNLCYEIQGKQEFTERYSQTIFVSYDRDDKAQAEKLNTALKQRGIKSWFDVRDMGVVAHRSEIKKVIGSPGTSIFLCLLSKSLIDKPEADSYVKKLEWKVAEARQVVNESQRESGNIMRPFHVFPVAVDDCTQYMEKLPDFIKDINIRSYDDPDLMDEIENKLKC